MSDSPAGTGARRIRREPPAFRDVTVVRTGHPTPRVVRVVFDGPDLHSLIVDEPAASVRLLLPSPGTSNLVIPTWNGNEFLLANGQRPTIRTFTPIRPSGTTSELLLDIVVHGSGAASDCRRSCRDFRSGPRVCRRSRRVVVRAGWRRERRAGGRPVARFTASRVSRVCRDRGDVARSDPRPPRAPHHPRQLACPARRSTAGNGAVRVCALRDYRTRIPYLGRR